MSLVAYLDNSKGTDDICEMLRTCSVVEIEELCNTYPVLTLKLDWDSIQKDYSNNKRFETITYLAEIFVQYESFLEQHPEFQLPRSLPAKDFADILMSRIIQLLWSHKDTEIAANIQSQLYNFAMVLIGASMNDDALQCLLVSKTSGKADHDFWIAACRFNIAGETKNPDDIANAAEAMQEILDGRVIVPERCLQGVTQMLDKLKTIQVNPANSEA